MSSCCLLQLSQSLDEVYASAGVTPLIIIPHTNFDEVTVKYHSIGGVKDGAGGVADNVTADDGLILQKEGNNIYIIIPFMDHPRLLEAVEEQISLVLQSKFGRVLTYVDVVGGLGPRGEDGRRKYLVDAPMDGQTGSAGASFAPSKRRYHNSPR